MAQVEIERDGAVMIVTLNRPHRKNAMTLTMFAQLADAWEEVTANDDIRCVILTGAEGDFSSGMDLRALAGDVAEPDAIDTDARMKEDSGFIYRGLLKTYRPTKPVIAAVEGVAIAGGTEILQGTDIRIAAESARFGVSEARWSLYPMGGSAVRPRRAETVAWEASATATTSRSWAGASSPRVAATTMPGTTLPRSGSAVTRAVPVRVAGASRRIAWWAKASSKKSPGSQVRRSVSVQKYIRTPMTKCE